MENSELLKELIPILSSHPLLSIISILVIMLFVGFFILQNAKKYLSNHSIEMNGLQTAQGIIESLKTEIERKNQEIEKLNKENNTLKLSVELSNNSKTGLISQIKQFEFEMTVVKYQCEEKTAEIEKLKKLINKLEKEVQNNG